jgi:hypothetical protein
MIPMTDCNSTPAFTSRVPALSIMRQRAGAETHRLEPPEILARRKVSLLRDVCRFPQGSPIYLTN